MITVIARIKIQDGKEEQALEHCRKMAGSMKDEPGALAYLCHRSLDNPSEIVFFELYADDEAFKAHGQTPHMGDFRAGFAELFDVTQVKIERFERLGGVVKPAAGG